jgi:carbon monoxide dehydrogenase subunit G
MLIEEKFTVKSPIEELWASLLNPEIAGTCIPGCEKVERINDREYDSIIKAKVGFIAVRFRVRTKIEETVPFRLIRTVGEGKELRNLGQFRQKTSVDFTKRSENETEISYRSEVSLVGKLATFGDRILKAKAKEIGKEFADTLRKRLEE